MGALVLPAQAVTPDDGTVNSTALNYFEGVVNKLPANCDYVIYRTGDYTSSMLFGFDLEVNGSNIVSSSECTELIYNTRGSGSAGYYYPSYSTVEHDSYFVSTSESTIVYSSLGNWASVGDPNKDTVSYILWTVVFLVLLFIVFKHFRNRRHYINL